MAISAHYYAPLRCLTNLVRVLVAVFATIFADTSWSREPERAVPQRTSSAIAAVVKDGRVIISRDGQTVLEYICPDRGPKSYVKSLTSPLGINVLRDSPPDHVHHHGLMFAVGVDNVDYWAEGPEFGIQVPEGLPKVRVLTENGRSIAILHHRLRWIDAQGHPQLSENRELIWYLLDDEVPAHLLVWRSHLEVAGEAPERTLWGRHYFGLGCRFVEAMDRGGRFSNSKGGSGVSGTNDKPAEWCAYSAAVNGKAITLVMFDHPNNPRYPAVWFTMDSPFAYLSATLGLAKQTYPLKAGQPIELQYGVVVSDGDLTAEQISHIYHLFPALTQDSTSM